MKEKLNVLVTGANGQLGSEIRNLVENSSSDNYIFADITSREGCQTEYLDIIDADALKTLCSEKEIDVIINCAAYTNVEMAEDDFANAILLNHRSVKNIAEVAAERDAAVVHISTDYVFSGDGTKPYKEINTPKPSGVYGVTKYYGELDLKSAGCRFLILRSAWLFSPFGHNFVKTILKLTAEKEEIKVVFDQVGSPTYAYDLAAVIVKVISERRFDMFGKGMSRKETGIWHYANEGAVSWYDFSCAVSRLGVLADQKAKRKVRKCEIKPCLTDEFALNAPRPAYSVLDKSKIKNCLGITIPHWFDSLEDCISRIEKES